MFFCLCEVGFATTNCPQQQLQILSASRRPSRQSSCTPSIQHGVDPQQHGRGTSVPMILYKDIIIAHQILIHWQLHGPERLGQPERPQSLVAIMPRSWYQHGVRLYSHRTQLASRPTQTRAQAMSISRPYTEASEGKQAASDTWGGTIAAGECKRFAIPHFSVIQLSSQSVPLADAGCAPQAPARSPGSCTMCMHKRWSNNRRIWFGVWYE